MSDSATADLGRTALAAGLLSGLPSTGYALLRGTDPLAATRAAGRLLLPDARSDATLLPAAAFVHAVLTVGWTAALRRLPGGVLRGAAYGLAIATLDLGSARLLRGRRFDAVAALPLLPQLADHIAFGMVVSGTGHRPEACRRFAAAG